MRQLNTPWKYGNCLIFALVLWFKYGGYVIARKSRHGWWPHFMWVKSLGELEIIEFTPRNAILYSDRLRVPPPVFRGYVRKGRDE